MYKNNNSDHRNVCSHLGGDMLDSACTTRTNTKTTKLEGIKGSTHNTRIHTQIHHTPLWAEMANERANEPPGVNDQRTCNKKKKQKLTNTLTLIKQIYQASYRNTIRRV